METGESEFPPEKRRKISCPQENAISTDETKASPDKAEQVTIDDDVEEGEIVDDETEEPSSPTKATLPSQNNSQPTRRTSSTPVPPSPSKSTPRNPSKSSPKFPFAPPLGLPAASQSEASKLDKIEIESNGVTKVEAKETNDSGTSVEVRESGDNSPRHNDETDRLLDDLSGGPKVEVPTEPTFQFKTKNVFREVSSKAQLGILPPDWIEIDHVTGLKMYMHTTTRVFTTSRPWQVNYKAQATVEPLPLSAVPCLAYRLAKENLEKTRSCMKSASAHEQTKQDEEKPTDLRASKSVDSVAVSNRISDDELREYCKKLYIIEEIQYKVFTDWDERRQHCKQVKRQRQEESLKASCKENEIVTIPVSILPDNLQRDAKLRLKNDMVFNPAVKKYTEIMNSYSSWAVKKVPDCEYDLVTKGTSGPEYNCKLSLDGVQYGVGRANSKKSAREMASKDGLNNVLPAKYMDQIKAAKESVKNTATEELKGHDSITVFDDFAITDKRVYEMSKSLNQTIPMVVLKHCIARNLALDESAIKIETNVMPRKRLAKVELTMTVGGHTALVRALNAKLASQYAAQNIIQKLHPHLRSWGSIIRLYGNFAEGNPHDLAKKKAAQAEITRLSAAKPATMHEADGHCYNQVLEKLKEHMKEIYHKRKRQPKKKFEPLVTAAQLYNPELTESAANTHSIDNLPPPLPDLPESPEAPPLPRGPELSTEDHIEPLPSVQPSEISSDAILLPPDSFL